jgi:hypothetical protein
VPDYRRNRVPGGTFFFMDNLLDRRSDLLVTRIDALRDAVRQFLFGQTPTSWGAAPIDCKQDPDDCYNKQRQCTSSRSVYTEITWNNHFYSVVRNRFIFIRNRNELLAPIKRGY